MGWIKVDLFGHDTYLFLLLHNLANSITFIIPMNLAAQDLMRMWSCCGCNSISVLFEQILASVCIAYSSCSLPEVKLSNQLWYDGVQPVLSVVSVWMNGPVWFGVALFRVAIKQRCQEFDCDQAWQLWAPRDYKTPQWSEVVKSYCLNNSAGQTCLGNNSDLKSWALESKGRAFINQH